MDPQAAAGRFIVIEGIDGAGTSTQAGRLVDWLEQRGRRALLTAEPTRGPVGALLRQVMGHRLVARLPDGSSRPMANDVIALLFAADRLDHLQVEIEPWLATGAVVVSDRYYHSSLLYQSLDGDLDWIRRLNAHARSPDVTYVLELPADQAAARRSNRSAAEMYERDALQRRLVDGYRRLAVLLPDETIVPIDGAQPADAVHAAIIHDLGRRLGLAVNDRSGEPESEDR